MKNFYKLTMLFIAFTISTSLMAQIAVPPSIGDGTSDDPYQIATLDNLYWISQNSGEWTKHYIQTTNIVATSTSGWDSNAGFSPIGNGTNKFTGDYDGDNHTIDGLTINRSVTEYIGFFGHVQSANIKNLGVTNVSITGNSYVGGLTGYDNLSTFNNSYCTGDVSGTNYISGLVGRHSNSSIINNCNNAGSVSGTENVGGLVGYNYANLCFKQLSIYLNPPNETRNSINL